MTTPSSELGHVPSCSPTPVARVLLEREAPPGADVPLETPAAEVLEQLLGSSGSLVRWNRGLPPAVTATLERWAAGGAEPRDGVVEAVACDLGAARLAIEDALMEVEEGPAREWLVRDMRMLVERFVALTHARRFRLFFGPIRTDQCRKFHIDHIRMRLITTYAGPGTEWIADEDVCRSALLHPPDCPCEANESILLPGGVVRHAEPGDVLLMKGARCEEGVFGSVHRSPPLEGTGRVRVVLIVSTVHETRA